MLRMDLKAARRGFFDREAVQRKVDLATRRVLSRFGAFTRTRAKSSIRRPPKKSGLRASEPGRPPYSHTGLLRKFIFFAYDGSRHSVVIGPAKLSDKRGSAPELLEHGGSVTGKDPSGGRRRMRYESRPYMRPAFEAELEGLPDLWKDSVRR